MRAVATTIGVSLACVMALFAVGALAVQHFGLSEPVASFFGWQAVLFATLAFCCEYVDSTLGMGYGTALTPLLMILFGLEPLVVVPCVLLSELVTGLSAGAAHHLAGNVSFTRTSRATKVAGVLAACSALGVGLAVVVALSLPKFWLKLGIGLIVFSMGVIILWTSSRSFRFSWTKVVGLGLAASFNKGVSGGGYGPLVTSGQILSGVEEKSAIGITSVAEGLTCAVGVGIYLLAGQHIAWHLALPLVVGALASVPASALTVHHINTRGLRKLIGVATLCLGLLTLGKLVL